MFTVRPATETDAIPACEVMRRSIRELCSADHRNDAKILAAWLENKTPANMIAWVKSKDNFSVVALRGSEVCGFALLQRNGEVNFCYVVPEVLYLGAGKAMLAALESEAAHCGLKRLTLTSTSTARSFYERQGYSASGAPISIFGLQQAFPMEKQIALQQATQRAGVGAKLRAATRDDVPAMHRIRQAVRENRPRTTAVTETDYIPYIEEHGCSWVVEVQDEIVGFAVGDVRDGNIWALFVHPDHEKRGYGKQLHDRMVESLWNRGLNKLQLTTDPGTRAQGFYEAAGWQCKGSTSKGTLRFELCAQPAAPSDAL